MEARYNYKPTTNLKPWLIKYFSEFPSMAFKQPQLELLFSKIKLPYRFLLYSIVVLKVIIWIVWTLSALSSNLKHKLYVLQFNVNKNWIYLWCVLFQTRCPVCFKFFCCPTHRADHEMKNHSALFSKRGQDALVRMFQRKAEVLLQKNKERQISKNIVQSQLVKKDRESRLFVAPKQLPAFKRLHSEMNKRILSTSMSIMTESRRIIVPVHRRQTLSNLGTPGNKEEADSNYENKQLTPLENKGGVMVKTSTPIPESLFVQKTAKNEWENESPASSISNFQTPSQVSLYNRVEEKSNSKFYSSKPNFTPLKGIISKVSKYSFENETNQNSSASMRGRRVTFSFNSQLSGSSVGNLESIREVEQIVQRADDNSCVVNMRATAIDSFSVVENIPSTRDMQRFMEDSSPMLRQGGFFSCVTDIFCSAIHTIPSLSWKNARSSGTKRSRSPEPQESQVFQSPVHKRPCYPCDLRENPIRSRRPIAHS